MQSLVTEARLNNTISKTGNVAPGDKAKVKQVFEMYIQETL